MAEEKPEKPIKLKENYFSYHIKWCWGLGIDVGEITNPILKVMFYIYSISLLGFCIFVYFFLEFCGVVFESASFYEMSFGLCYWLTHIMGAGKVAMVLIKKKQIREMLGKLQKGIFAPNMNRGGLKEFKLIKSAIKLSDIHLAIFNYCVYFILGTRSIYAIIDKGEEEEYFDKTTNETVTVFRRTLPYAAWTPWDKQQSPLFEFTFFYQVFSLQIFGFCISVIDAILYGMMIHIKTHCLILKICLENFVTMSKQLAVSKNPSIYNKNGENIAAPKVRLPKEIERVEMSDDSILKEMNKMADYCIDYHYEIIDYCERLENEFSILVLCQFLTSLYTLCFQLFQVSVSHPGSFEFVSMCLFLCLIFYQLSCYCWHGNELILTSAAIADSIYNSNWVIADNKIRQKLLIMMIRAQRPLQITAGKFALLSLQTYMSIVRGSASYFMVLRQMNGEK